jgi:hypothetical protein
MSAITVISGKPMFLQMTVEPQGAAKIASTLLELQTNTGEVPQHTMLALISVARQKAVAFHCHGAAGAFAVMLCQA